MPSVKNKEKRAQYEDFFMDGGDWSPGTESEINSYFNRKTGGKMGSLSVSALLSDKEAALDKLSALDFRKRAEIIKRVQSNFNRALPGLTDQEPDLSPDILSDVARCPGPGLSSLTSLGIVLKPREFQRMSLCNCGHPDLADRLEEEGCCFSPTCSESPSPFPHMGGELIPSLIERLLPFIEERSGLWPPLGRRMVRITIIMPRKGMGMTDMPPHHALFDRLADDYSGYRHSLLSTIPRLVPRVIDRAPEVIEPLLMGDRELPLYNLDLVKDRLRMLESLLGMFPSIYFNRAHLPGPVSSSLEAHPNTRGLERESAFAAL